MKRTVLANSITRSSGSSRTRKQQKFVVCIDNSGYLASLLVRKIYRTIDDRDAQREGMIRVIDESGEDYLYDAERFVNVELAQDAQRALLRAE
jgi:hypothetical protein